MESYDGANAHWLYFLERAKNNVIPKTKTIELPNKSEAGIAIEGSENWWPNSKAEIVLPTYNSVENKSYFIDIFNRGKIPFDFKITSKENWIKFSKSKGKINSEE